MTRAPDFDAIVVGSGITGGWAAKELTEQGLRVLLLERGRAIEHGKDYLTEHQPAWEIPMRGLGLPGRSRNATPERPGSSRASSVTGSPRVGTGEGWPG
jgi:choline dehydrogenase-like flavoprotein